MFVIDRDRNRALPIEKASFSALGIRERDHLQEWVANDPSVLGEELLVIQKEFAGFSDTSERLDLLALDKQGNLAVIENKLDDTGRDVVWQALKYASYCSSLTKDQIRSIFQAYLDRYEAAADAEERLVAYFDQEYEELELNQGQTQRIILIAANFRKEVTSTVLWLLNYRVRLQCFKVTPYEMGDRLLINLEQIIPMRDAEDYVISMAAKNQDEANTQSAKTRRHRVRREFWTQLLGEMNRRSELFRTISPGEHPWIGTGAGVGSISFNFVATRGYGRAELYINRDAEESLAIFHALLAQKTEVEADFGGPLVWDEMDGQQACRIKTEYPGDIYDRERWPDMIQHMTDGMIRLVPALKGRLQEVVRGVRE
jgi:hypothetical protein